MPAAFLRRRRSLAFIPIIAFSLSRLPYSSGSTPDAVIVEAHMLVQIPALAVAGGVAAMTLPDRWRERVAAWNRCGITGMLLALIVSAWWMVPRALDGAIASGAMETLKFASLPLLVGAPVALSWRELPFVGKGFVLANVLPMWAVVGWLSIAAPVPVCNYYLVDQQVVAGYGLIGLSIAVGGAVVVVALIRNQSSASHKPS